MNSKKKFDEGCQENKLAFLTLEQFLYFDTR